MKVSEIMNKAIVIDDKVSVREAAKIMSGKGIGSMIIVNGGDIKGILTERDILKNLDKINSKITSVMSRKVVCIDINEDVEDAVKKMANFGVKRLPVLRDKKLVGLISMTDIISRISDFDEEFMIN